jgi:hypothetical protein
MNDLFFCIKPGFFFLQVQSPMGSWQWSHSVVVVVVDWPTDLSALILRLPVKA